MNWAELEKIAREKGWKFAKHGKKHDIYLHDEYLDIYENNSNH